MSEYHTLPRLYVSAPLREGEILELSKDQTHYLRGVLRLQEGDAIRVFNGLEGEFKAVLEGAGKKSGLVRTAERIKPQPPRPPRIHLIFAPIKKARLDMLIEKAVELGASDLHPVLTERTENRHIKPERLEAQITEALEQCERLEKPILHEIQPLGKLLSGWKTPQILACVERRDAPHIATALAPNQDIALLIGPEGGFTPKELEAITQAPACLPVSLGEAVLRAETAAIFGLSVISAGAYKNGGGHAKIG